mmetsp:Transcript_45137/g.106326  ORF Transcript_45137/g.106326 Transcript_45137/m.106326 type:complete len:191 (+) Transcript_45137:33-605(+)
MAPPSKGEKGGGGKTVIDKVLSAIRTHESPTGSSLAYLKKHLKAEYEFDNATVLLKALKKAVADGKLSQPTKSSYAIPGLEFALPADEIVSMTDTTVGTGKEAKSGSNVTMRYEGRLTDGHVFDKADRFKFQIDGGEVIKGWDRGIKGMKVGGERELSIPSKLGYGKKGSSPDIPPDATLLFTVGLLSVS